MEAIAILGTAIGLYVLYAVLGLFAIFIIGKTIDKYEEYVSRRTETN